MLNSVAARRRLARRTVGFQAIATAATALICLFQSSAAATGALAGGAALTLGSAFAAWRALGGGVVGPGVALGRLIGATALKWMLVVVGLYLALGVWRLPAGPVFAGAAVAALAWLPAAVFGSRVGDRTGGPDPGDTDSE